MSFVFRAFLLLLCAGLPAQAAASSAASPSLAPQKPSASQETPDALSLYTPHVLGKDSARVRVDEYSSLTCSHCADFFLDTLPEIQKRYIDTGKVKFVIHDFPLDGVSLKAAAIAHCLPKDIYVPFVRTIYDALKKGTLNGDNAETVIVQYAALGGLPPDKASACASNPKIQEAIIADRAHASKAFNIDATPTFVINDGSKIIGGAVSLDSFAAALDPLIAAKK